METVIVLLVVAAALAYVAKRIHGQLTGKTRCSLGRGSCTRTKPECNSSETDCRKG